MGDTFNVILEGLVISERHVDNGKREICIQSARKESFTVLLDASAYPETSKWFSVKKARNLIYKGVGVRVCGSYQEDNDDVIHATSLHICSVNPSKQYLARLFSFSLDDLYILFPYEIPSENLPPPFVKACAPISEDILQKVYEFSQRERSAGRGAKLWKTLEIEELSTQLFESQSENTIIQSKPKNLCIPKVSKQSLEAVRRMERLYLRPCDGDIDEYIFHPETCTYSTKRKVESDIHEAVYYGDIDPCHNLPVPHDERRLKYVDERKRPQIKCMLEILQELLDRRQNKNCPILRAADIGGGRGYFGIAVAGTFSNIHVTVVDNNDSSLQAGRSRAEAAGLDNMDFVHCDLGDSKQVEKLGQFDIVFGLHCCGGLAEAAVEVALKCMADFCVSTCCFRSNPELASLTRFAENIIRTKNEDDDDEVVSRYKRDVSSVATLSVTVGGNDQHCAIRAYNSMRLVAAEKKFHMIHSKSELQTWQETFPVEYSVQNRVLVGTIVE